MFAISGIHLYRDVCGSKAPRLQAELLQAEEYAAAFEPPRL